MSNNAADGFIPVVSRQIRSTNNRGSSRGGAPNSRGRGGQHQAVSNQRPMSNGSSHHANTSYSNYEAFNGNSDPLKTKQAFEKDSRLIKKHDATSERATRLFTEEIEKSRVRIKFSFDELRAALSERERQLLTELDKVKSEGVTYLKERATKAKDLHSRIDRAPTMHEKETRQLHHDIKSFTAEDKIEDSLSRMARFQYEPDKVLSMLRTYGEVFPIKAVHPRSLSVSSTVSASSSAVDYGYNSNSGLEVASVAAGVQNGQATMAVEKTKKVVLNGISIQSDTMSEEQLAMINKALQENLKQQGITTDVIQSIGEDAKFVPKISRPRSERGGRGRGRGGRGGYAAVKDPDISILN